MKRTPLVSVGQGDYRRDYHGAEDFRLVPWVLFLVALVCISIGAILIEQMNQPSGARADDSRPIAQPADSGALGS
jgi:hypothetical protein